MVDLNAHEAGNGGQSQGKPTAPGVLLYSEGYDRIVGALANLGHQVSDQTVGNILRRRGIAPVPERSQTTTWRAFIRRHIDVLVGTDGSGANSRSSSIQSVLPIEKDPC